MTSKMDNPPPKPPKLPTDKQIRSMIDKENAQALSNALKQHPQLFQCQSPNYLKICCLANKVTLISIILEHFHSDYRKKFICDSLIECIRFQKLQIVKIFIQKGFQIHQTLPTKNTLKLSSIDFAILGGHYEIAVQIYKQLDTQNRNIRNYKQYEMIAKKYQYRYVNYQIFINGLCNNLTKEQVGNYLKKQLSEKRKKQIRRIYEESCWDWILRVFGFGNKKKIQGENKNPNSKHKPNQNESNDQKNAQLQDNPMSTQRNLSLKQPSKK